MFSLFSFPALSSVTDENNILSSLIDKNAPIKYNKLCIAIRLIDCNNDINTNPFRVNTHIKVIIMTLLVGLR